MVVVASLTPLVLLPQWDNQNGVVIRVDNVRLVRD